jgi:hypothetical protein
MSVSNILDASGKIKAIYLRETLSSVPEGLAGKIEALEEFARLIAEVVAIQLEDSSTYQYTGVPQGLVATVVPMMVVTELAKEPEDPSITEISK